MKDRKLPVTSEKPKQRPFHEEFAEKVIAHLQAGTAPWQQPWHLSDSPSVPHNPASGTVYRGMNRVNLALSGYEDPRWMTLRQANDKGLSITQGSKATPVVYYQFSKEQDRLDEDGKPVLDEDGQPLKQTVQLDKPLVRFAHVFNAEQIEGIPPRDLTGWSFAWEPIEKAENILSASGANLNHDQSNRAFTGLQLIPSICRPAKILRNLACITAPPCMNWGIGPSIQLVWIAKPGLLAPKLTHEKN